MNRTLCRAESRIPFTVSFRQPTGPAREGQFVTDATHILIQNVTNDKQRTTITSAVSCSKAIGGFQRILIARIT